MSAQVVFLHVMKTGGTTFRSILASIYGSRFHVCTDPAVDAVEQSLASCDCMEFHLRNRGASGWVHDHSELVAQRRWDMLAGRDIFIMFRDPVDQILSHYFAMQRLRAQIEPRMQVIGAAFPETFDDFLANRAHFNNQTAFVLGKSQAEGNYVDRDDLAEAKAVLDGLEVHIGLMVRFADSLTIFQSVTGMQIPPYQRLNQTSGRPALREVSPEIRQRIASQSTLDIELYEFAKQRFSEEFAACEPERNLLYA